MRFTVSVVITALFAASAIAAATSNVTNSATILEVNSSDIASVKDRWRFALLLKGGEKGSGPSILQDYLGEHIV
ncbi:hypothetical protein D9613_004576 [Agrocybe pediades]|uniref:Uncharacterized protein n=1 Tax=Agrocybe pediades TaxID=84607 RepID=A0A8H4VKX3_9AGAR|nr:hypothetical protein D9613_004576 [Agrocybe pediades]